jgi:formylglycine-generating enzyme required for sulfatase activity/serine/threonine protein kinase
MSGSFAFFKFVAKAALNCVGFGLAGDFVGEVLPDMAREVYARWAKGKTPEQLRAEVQAVARTGDDEARRLAARAVAEEAPLQPEALQLSLITYLAQLPAAVRQTQRSLADPSGRSVSPALVLSRPADVLALLPPRLPRFGKGRRAPGFPDWQLEELLGIGGFGEVWKAHNPHLPSEPPVALKFCLDEAAARMLRNEVALLDQVRRQGRHPGIVALLDTALNSDPPCLKYEYVSGGDLTGLLQAWHQGPRGEVPRLALRMVRQLAEVVAFAHGLTPPIVHRDLKPANILLQKGGNHGATEGTEQTKEQLSSGRSVALWFKDASPKIADFGIGAIVSGQGMGTLATQPHASRVPTAVRGSCTPLYASPQQLRGDDPHPRDDVFALGVIWYQMLTGRLTEQPGTDWREELEGCDAGDGVLDLLGRCLAVREERRLSHAGELVEQLERLGKPRASVRTMRAVPAAEEEDEEPPDEDSDDPLDLAARVQRSLARAQRTLTRALRLAEQEQDYPAAVRLLEGLPEPFRDSGLLDVYRSRRDRVQELQKGVRADVQACRYAGLRDRIEELLTLTPRDEEMRRLLGAVPWEPGAEVTNAAGMKLVLLQPGAFQMGSPASEAGRLADEGPVHTVEITSRFYLGAYPVTQEQYRRVTGANPAHFRAAPGCDTRHFPVENVSWEEAADFCARLSALPEEQQRGRAYRLPTEAEWEYACRGGAGESRPFSFGGSLGSADANFDGRHPYGSAPKGHFLQRPGAVGSYPPNAFGLYDMHGNVWEWCADWYSDRYYRHSPTRDPRGPDRGEARVLRGGSWQNYGRLLRSAHRDWVGPGYHGFAVGFRVVLMVSAPTG